MQTLAERMRAIRAIHDRITDPTLSISDKCSLLETAVTDGKKALSGSAKSFFKLAAGRGDCLLFMAVSYQDLYRLKNGIVPVQLIPATPVGDERKARLKKLVENVEHGNVEWTHTVDPSIDGGFVLLVDGFRLDASVAGKLQKIRKELIEKNNRII